MSSSVETERNIDVDGRAKPTQESSGLEDIMKVFRDLSIGDDEDRNRFLKFAETDEAEKQTQYETYTRHNTVITDKEQHA